MDIYCTHVIALLTLQAKLCHHFITIQTLERHELFFHIIVKY